VSELARLERSEKSEEHARRIHVVILAINRWTVGTGDWFSRRVCQEWGARFNRAGLSGQDDRHRRVLRSALTLEQEIAIPHRLETAPAEFDQVCSLRAMILNASCWQSISPRITTLD
jgi:hypothetical protein